MRVSATPGNLSFIVAPGFNCQLKYDNMPITEPNPVTGTSSNPRNSLSFSTLMLLVGSFDL